MKKYTFLILLLLPFFSMAQKEAYNWYFGAGVGLDFSNSPPQPTTNYQLGSQEATAIASDYSGKLLFYCNGRTIYNKKFQQLQNGDNLLGDLSSTNGVVIVPIPAGDGTYYVFTVGVAGTEDIGLRYTAVDMKGDGGNGVVTQKNILLDRDAFESVAAVRHCNNIDTWIVIRKWDSDEYHTYLITASGISAPVVSHTGLTISGFFTNSIGELKFSVDGRKLAAAHSFDADVVELMNFDNSTGLLTNPIIFHPNTSLHTNSFPGTYGVEFSPDANLIYVTASNSVAVPSILYQFDIAAPNVASIEASRQVIFPGAPQVAGQLSLGPDGKIYMCLWQESYLCSIQNPNVYGPGCNFKLHDIFMGGGTTVQFGLPNFIKSYLNPNANPHDFSRSVGDCTDHDVNFTISRTADIDSVLWDFGDAQQSKLLAPAHHYNTEGYFTVTLTIYKPNCSGLNETVRHTVWIAPVGNLLGSDIASCVINNIPLTSNILAGASFLWSTGATTNSITVNSPGLYWLKLVNNDGCKMSDSITITLKAAPTVNLGPDTTYCSDKKLVLDAGGGATNYLWSTGATSRSIDIKGPGEYIVKVETNGCTAADTALVSWGDCDIFIPSAFTPNKDGINDKFGAVSGSGVKDFSLKIYDRYGQVAFAARDIGQKWDGDKKGLPMGFGAYPWIISYTTFSGKKIFLHGTVMLIR